tara:strand:- start:26 stop:265 length:240 start_codon:yes stop_codon:yes gene_type:complete
MSLLQRRHYNHLAEMTKRIVETFDNVQPPQEMSFKDAEEYMEFVQGRIQDHILNYMRIGNMNFNEHRFKKAAGMINEEE